MDIVYRPLRWPTGQKRTPTSNRQVAPYRMVFHKTLEALQKTLRQWKASCIVLTSQIPLTPKGMPKAPKSAATVAGIRAEGEPGVALYLRLPHPVTGEPGEAPMVLACDQWDTLAGNLRAVSITLEGMRSIQRAGAAELTERAFTGFTALGAPPTDDAPWNAVLGVSIDADVKAIRSAYREKARKAHPDCGGSTEAMQAVDQAYEKGLLERNVHRNASVG